MSLSFSASSCFEDAHALYKKRSTARRARRGGGSFSSETSSLLPSYSSSSLPCTPPHLNASESLPYGTRFRGSGVGESVEPRRHRISQIVSTDWVEDSIAEAARVNSLRDRQDWRGRIQAYLDGTQGWVLSGLLGLLTALVAYAVYMCEDLIFDLKTGYCAKGWYLSEKRCCGLGRPCDAWIPWARILQVPYVHPGLTGFAIYVCLVVVLAVASHMLTAVTRTVVASSPVASPSGSNRGSLKPRHGLRPPQSLGVQPPAQVAGRPFAVLPVYFPAAGSGIVEIQVILSGFVFSGFLSVKVLLTKMLALILSVASGLSLGKEGPLIHIAASIGNTAGGLFSKYRNNDSMRRGIVSAATAAGIAVAFGAPIGGVLFSMEEVVSFPGKNLFQTFFCCITAALTLKFLNPYGTSKIVIFEVRYLRDWEFFELGAFMALGILGGGTGAIFIKACRVWARRFRSALFKDSYLLEVALTALLTGLISHWNPYTDIPVAKLLFTLTSPCHSTADAGLCPQDVSEISRVMLKLSIALLIKGALTIITFGIKVPAGIYLPSMVIGGLLGRIIGHAIQWLVLRFPTSPAFSHCAAHSSGMSCVTPGVYALIAAGSTMCGVTRLSVTLAIILFELTGSLDYVLPFSIAILLARWTADAIEPMNIYDLLTHTNSYPSLAIKHKPTLPSDLTDIMHCVRSQELMIDISDSPLVPAYMLHQKLGILHEDCEIDECLPIVRDDVLLGLISVLSLKVALDCMDVEPSTPCLMAAVDPCGDLRGDNHQKTPVDLRPYVDVALVALDIHSPVDFVRDCFLNLGLRYICVTQEGKFVGLVHSQKDVRAL